MTWGLTYFDQFTLSETRSRSRILIIIVTALSLTTSKVLKMTRSCEILFHFEMKIYIHVQLTFITLLHFFDVMT